MINDLTHSRLQDAFIDFAENGTIKIEETDCYYGQQLQMIATRTIDRRTNIKGLSYILIPLPSEGDVEDLFDPVKTKKPIRLKEDLVTYRGEGRYLQLGPACLLNVSHLPSGAELLRSRERS